MLEFKSIYFKNDFCNQILIMFKFPKSHFRSYKHLPTSIKQLKCRGSFRTTIKIDLHL